MVRGGGDRLIPVPEDVLARRPEEPGDSAQCFGLYKEMHLRSMAGGTHFKYKWTDLMTPMWVRTVSQIAAVTLEAS